MVACATKGNGEIIPALIPTRGYGYDPDLAPYTFDPNTGDVLTHTQTAGLLTGAPGGVRMVAGIGKPLADGSSIQSFDLGYPEFGYSTMNAAGTVLFAAYTSRGYGLFTSGATAPIAVARGGEPARYPGCGWWRTRSRASA